MNMESGSGSPSHENNETHEKPMSQGFGGIEGQLGELDREATALNHRLLDISSLAAAVYNLWEGHPDRDAHPLVHAGTLCKMIEAKADAEAECADFISLRIGRIQDGLKQSLFPE
jgi:hypothetical protein